MAQTIVREAIRAAVPGMIADLQNSDVFSRAAENEVAFGHGVVQGTDKEAQTKTPDAAVTAFIGVAAKDHKEQRYVPTLGVNKYDINDMVGVLQKGRIWVPVPEAVAVGDSVYLWFAAGTVVAGAVAGQFGKTADAGKNTQIAAGAKWVKGAAAGGNALLELNLPV